MEARSQVSRSNCRRARATVPSAASTVTNEPTSTTATSSPTATTWKPETSPPGLRAGCAEVWRHRTSPVSGSSAVISACPSGPGEPTTTSPGSAANPIAGGADGSATTRPSTASTTTTRDAWGGRDGSPVHDRLRSAPRGSPGTRQGGPCPLRPPRCRAAARRTSPTPGAPLGQDGVGGGQREGAPAGPGARVERHGAVRPVGTGAHTHGGPCGSARPRSAPPGSASATCQSARTSASTGGRTPGSRAGRAVAARSREARRSCAPTSPRVTTSSTAARRRPRPACCGWSAGGGVVVVDHLHLLHATRRPHLATVGLRRAACRRGGPARGSAPGLPARSPASDATPGGRRVQIGTPTEVDARPPCSWEPTRDLTSGADGTGSGARASSASRTCT